jgi:hypothetical protein
MIHVLLFLALAADPGGWQNARWGMTVNQVLAAVPTAARLEKPEKFSDGRIAPIGITRDDRRILFICAPDLVAVEMEFKRADRDTFARIEALLVQQYGRPWHRQGEDVERSQWTFDTTIITLRRVSSRTIRFESLWLTYERRGLSDF